MLDKSVTDHHRQNCRNYYFDGVILPSQFKAKRKPQPMVISDENFALDFVNRKEGFTFLKSVRSNGPDKILRVKERSFYHARKFKDKEGNYVKNVDGTWAEKSPRLECIPSNVKIRFGSGPETREIVLKPHKPRQIIPLHAESVMHHAGVNHEKIDMLFMTSTVLYLGDGRVQIHNPLKQVPINYGRTAPKPERVDGGSSPVVSESVNSGKEQGLVGAFSSEGSSKRSCPPSSDVSSSGHAAKKTKVGGGDGDESMANTGEGDGDQSMSNTGGGDGDESITFKDKLKDKLKELLKMKPDAARKALKEMDREDILGAKFLAKKLCQDAKKKAKKSYRKFTYITFWPLVY